MVANREVEDGCRADKGQREKQTCGNVSHSFSPILSTAKTSLWLIKFLERCFCYMFTICSVVNR